MELRDRKQRASVKRGLEWIEEHTTFGDDGAVRTSVDIAYYSARELIVSYSPLDPKIPERTRRIIVAAAITRWLRFKKYREHPDKVDSFIAALAIELRKRERTQQDYRILMFLNASYRDLERLKPISIQDRPIEVLQWNDLSGLDTSRLWDQVRSYDSDSPLIWGANDNRLFPNRSLFTPVSVELTTFGPEAAVEIASALVDVLRAVIHIPLISGTFTYFRAQEAALSTILPSPVYAVYDGTGNMKAVYFTIEKYQYRRANLREDRLDTTIRLLGRFGKNLEYPESDHFVLGIIRLYQDALDTALARSAFLAMWQVLEALAGFGEEKVEQRKLTSRIRVLVKLQSPFDEVFQLLIQRRNELVHTGLFPERGDDSFFTLKVITDAAVRSLLALANEFPTIYELREYVSLANLPDADLSRKRQVIEKIQSYRTQK